MKIIRIGLLLAFINFAYAQGCVIGEIPSHPRYVCFDGKTLQLAEDGHYRWNAKRGCFVSAVPCCAYKATHYAFYPDPTKIGAAYARCRHNYPFHLGEMQTH